MLSDIGLPGWTVRGGAAAAEGAGVPGILLVAITGYNGEDDRRRGKEAGFDHHLAKPADVARLQRILGGAGVVGAVRGPAGVRVWTPALDTRACLATIQAFSLRWFFPNGHDVLAAPRRGASRTRLLFEERLLFTRPGVRHLQTPGS